jgi:hypothetical protein
MRDIGDGHVIHETGGGGQEQGGYHPWRITLSQSTMVGWQAVVPCLGSLSATVLGLPLLGQAFDDASLVVLARAWLVAHLGPAVACLPYCVRRDVCDL